jgi:hypothetical protein
VVAGFAVASTPVNTQAWRPFQTMSPAGRPVVAMPRAAARTASAMVAVAIRT